MSNQPLLFLSDSDIRRALPMADAVAAMREAFVQLSRGRIVLPVRQQLATTDVRGTVLIMPCHASEARLFSLKNVSVFDDNRRHGLPRIQATLLLTDGTTGSPLAVMEADVLTAIRTGAASGLATEVLSQPSAEVAAIIGTGVQAQTQLEAVCCVRAIRRALVYGRNAAAAQEFAADSSQKLGIPVEPVRTPAEALRHANVICTATNSAVPVFADRDVSAGAHINAVGSYQPDAAEIPIATVCRARVVVDHRMSALQEAGDLLIPLRKGLLHESHFDTELGAVVLDRSLGRRRDDEITLFKSVGIAVQDLYAAARALENARRLGIGTPVNTKNT